MAPGRQSRSRPGCARGKLSVLASAGPKRGDWCELGRALLRPVQRRLASRVKLSAQLKCAARRARTTAAARNEVLRVLASCVGSRLRQSASAVGVLSSLVQRGNADAGGCSAM